MAIGLGLGLVLAGLSAFGATINWNTGSGTWDDSTTANWDIGRVPTNGDIVNLTRSTAGAINIGYVSTNFAGNNALASFTLGNAGGGLTTLTLGSTNGLQSGPSATINSGGCLVVNAGSYFAETTVVNQIRFNLNGGSVLLNGGDLTNLSQLGFAAGTYTQTGGTHVVGWHANVQPAAGQTATFTMSGGVFSNLNYDLNFNGNGNFVLKLLDGALMWSVRDIYIGNSGAGTNLVYIKASRLERKGQANEVFGGGTGRTTMTNDGGRITGGNQYYLQDGATLSLVNGGYLGTGHLYIDGGALLILDSVSTNYSGFDVWFGDVSNKFGRVAVNGGYFRGRGLIMGSQWGNGVFTLTNGAACTFDNTSGYGMTISATNATRPSRLELWGATIAGSAPLTINPLGAVQGHGTSTCSVALNNSGRVIADGRGAMGDATLNLTSYTSVTNSIDNTSSNGWYAVNQGRLTLRPLTVNATGTYPWGDAFYTGHTVLDLNNSAQIAFSAVTGSGTITGALYAVDRADVPAAPGNANLVSVHEFAPSAGISGYTYTLTIRYDTSAAGVAGNEDVLRLLRHNGSTWVNVTASRDVANKTITSVPLTAFSMFAVAIPTEPGLLLQVR
jgi:hypothetical protein